MASSSPDIFTKIVYMIHRFSQSGDDIVRVAAKPLGQRGEMEEQYPLIQLHDAQSEDHDLVGSIASEIINISGGVVVVYVRTDQSAFDPVYEEEPDPIYKAGRRLKAYFAPQPIAAQLTPFGLDVENKATIVFSKHQIYREFSDRMIRIGDVIQVPYNASGIKPDKYRILNAFDSGNFRYEWLYWSCQVENLTDDITIEPDNS